MCNSNFRGIYILVAVGARESPTFIALRLCLQKDLRIRRYAKYTLPHTMYLYPMFLQRTITKYSEQPNPMPPTSPPLFPASVASCHCLASPIPSAAFRPLIFGRPPGFSPLRILPQLPERGH